MSQNNQPFNPEEFAKWLVEGVKDTLQYRIKQTFNREQLMAMVLSKIPTRSQFLHTTLKQAFRKNGFNFELLKQGDAPFHLIRKRIKKEGPIEKRIILVPGFGDTPASWMTSFLFCKKEFEAHFDEIIVLDFPGYLGFLSHAQMVPSMEVLLNVVQMICEANPPTVLIGHSLGGSLAGKVAQNLKRPIEHLILIAPSGMPPEREKTVFLDFFLNMKERPLDDIIRKMVHSPKVYHGLMKPEIEQFYAKPELEEFVRSVKHEHFIDPKKPFNCQNLSVVWGDSDQFVPSHWIRHWVESFGPYLDAYLINETGHMPQMEHPKTTSDLLKIIIFGTQGNLFSDGSHDSRWQKIATHSKKFEFEAKFNDTDALSQKLIG